MRKKELYFENNQDVLSHEDWEKQGKPLMWFKMYDKDSITIFEDRAYGAIKLVTPQGENQARDIVEVKGIIAFSIYYTGILKVYAPYKLIS